MLAKFEGLGVIELQSLVPQKILSSLLLQCARWTMTSDEIGWPVYLAGFDACVWIRNRFGITNSVFIFVCSFYFVIACLWGFWFLLCILCCLLMVFGLFLVTFAFDPCSLEVVEPSLWEVPWSSGIGATNWANNCCCCELPIEKELCAGMPLLVYPRCEKFFTPLCLIPVELANVLAIFVLQVHNHSHPRAQLFEIMANRSPTCKSLPSWKLGVCATSWYENYWGFEWVSIEKIYLH